MKKLYLQDVLFNVLGEQGRKGISKFDEIIITQKGDIKGILDGKEMFRLSGVNKNIKVEIKDEHGIAVTEKKERIIDGGKITQEIKDALCSNDSAVALQAIRDILLGR